MEPCIKWRCRSPKGRGNFQGLFEPFQSIGNLPCSGRYSVAAKGIMQSLITSCSRRDHSVCQASAHWGLSMGEENCAKLWKVNKCIPWNQCNEAASFMPGRSFLPP